MLIMFAETQTSVIESAFQDFTERKDVAILLINQHVSLHSYTIRYDEEEGVGVGMGMGMGMGLWVVNVVAMKGCGSLTAVVEHLANAAYTTRSQTRSDPLWTGIKLLSQLYSRYRVKSTLTVSFVGLLYQGT